MAFPAQSFLGLEYFKVQNTVVGNVQTPLVLWIEKTSSELLYCSKELIRDEQEVGQQNTKRHFDFFKKCDIN